MKWNERLSMKSIGRKTMREEAEAAVEEIERKSAEETENESRREEEKKRNGSLKRSGWKPENERSEMCNRENINEAIQWEVIIMWNEGEEEKWNEDD